jgi:acyl carrier protein
MDRLEIAKRAKELLVEGLRLEISPDEIVDSEPIFGEGLGLDSIDALEFVVLIEERFGVAIPDENAARKAFASIDALTDFIQSERQAAAG